MIFFQSSANLPAGEKARVEYLLHRFVQFVGPDKISNNVASLSDISGRCGNPKSVENLLSFVGEHLGVSFSGLRIRHEIKVLAQTGGGG